MHNISTFGGNKIPSQFKPPLTLDDVNKRLEEVEDWKQYSPDPRTTLQKTVEYREVLIKRDETYGHWRIYDQHHQIIPDLEGIYTSIIAAKQSYDNYKANKPKDNENN